jgi:hypothetical protein
VPKASLHAVFLASRSLIEQFITFASYGAINGRFVPEADIADIITFVSIGHSPCKTVSQNYKSDEYKFGCEAKTVPRK